MIIFSACSNSSLCLLQFVWAFYIIVIKVHGEYVNDDAKLFSPSIEYEVLGPSSFPKPTDLLEPYGAVPVVQPTHGKHRSDVDAIFAYAEGYNLNYYLHFVETLFATNFKGDLVLAIAENRLLEEYVLEYLKSIPNVIIYHSDMDCFDTDRITPAPRRKMPSGGLDIFQMCQLHEVYGWIDLEGRVTRKAKDMREGRVVATLRYEWYWMWLQHYQKNSWIMILDARDSYFQSNPFVNLPRKNNTNLSSGLLYFFGENAEATRLGKSRKNMNWIKNGYGQPVLDALKDKPTICSGSTMGEAVAMEQYIRALISEKDESEIKMTGADQGFHNYLYYSHKLVNVKAISSITVWAQGKGIINNLGALRTKTLAEWGNYNETTSVITNWDGTPSSVVHQWDRDKALHNYIFRNKMTQLRGEWKTKT